MSGSMPLSLRPLALRREGDDLLTIDWSDGKTCKVAWQRLRKECPCASCREERLQPPDPFRILKASELAPLSALSVTPIGHYAYKITWSDGHDTGLYTLEYLRELCDNANTAKG